MKVIVFFLQRKNKEFDDELMSLTEKLLGSNPDFNTVWNIRKDIFLKFKEERFSFCFNIFL